MQVIIFRRCELRTSPRLCICNCLSVSLMDVYFDDSILLQASVRSRWTVISRQTYAVLESNSLDSPSKSEERESWGHVIRHFSSTYYGVSRTSNMCSARSRVLRRCHSRSARSWRRSKWKQGGGPQEQKVSSAFIHFHSSFS